MTPGEPDWTKSDADLERIALIDRQWNRQQVSFDRKSPHSSVEGGDGFEVRETTSTELAKNCLNAGLWEVLLFVTEAGKKALYYHAWFTFPLGHYWAIFEKNTGGSYLNHLWKLEHWVDPAGTVLRLENLRHVSADAKVFATLDPREQILSAGEQVSKRRTTLAVNLRTWADFQSQPPVRFAAFVPPGRYDLQQPRGSRFELLAHLEGATLRRIKSPASSGLLDELELEFSSADGKSKSRFIVSGVSLSSLPQLSPEEYPKGLYMPMGIGVPPFFQSYADLENSEPSRSPYCSFLLDSSGHWLNHHDISIDGPVLHLDANDRRILHVYLLSYERHSLVNEIKIQLSPAEIQGAGKL